MSTKKYKTIPEFLEDCTEEKRAQIEALRKIILSVDRDLIEHIKWSAPSYVLDGEDRITFNLLNKESVVKLVLHMGTGRRENKDGIPVLDDNSGLIVWSSDIRGVLSFSSLEDINVNQRQIEDVIKRWLTIKA